MKKITNEQIEQIKELKAQGKSERAIAKIIGVTPNTIRYHLSQEFRDYMRRYNRERYRKMSKEQKENYLKKKRDYQKDYHKNRYQYDPEFRKKQVESSKKYQKENYKRK